MANFKNLNMAQELLSHNDLKVVSSMMGLSKKLVYVKTGATVRAYRYNYTPESATHLERIIESDSKGLAAAVKSCRATRVEIGNIELDACVSADKQFVALQLMQFSDYTYHPISKVAFYEGEEAQFVSSIFE